MSDLSLASYLSDFTPRRIADADLVILEPEAIPETESLYPQLAFVPDATVDDLAVRDLISPESETVIEPSVDAGTSDEDLYQAGKNDGYTEASALFETQKQELIASHAEELEQLKSALTTELTTSCFDQIQAGLAKMESRIADHLALILRPLLAAELRDRTIAAFANEVRTLVHGPDTVRFEIRGPAELLEGFRQQPDIDMTMFTMVETHETEISLNLPDSVLETRLSALQNELNGIIS